MRPIKDLFSSGMQCLLAHGFGGKQKDMAPVLKMSTASLNDYLKGRREGDEGTRRRIARHLGVSYDGLLRLGEAVLENNGDLQAPSLIEKIEKIRIDHQDAYSPEFTSIPVYRAKFSGDQGSFDTSDQMKADLAFRTEFIRSRGNPAKMALFEINGETMHPFLYDGDVVLVDMQQNNPLRITDGKAYAFREGGVVKVKRLSIQGKKLIATSENSRQYPPYTVDPEEFHLIGRVIWVGHEVR